MKTIKTLILVLIMAISPAAFVSAGERPDLWDYENNQPNRNYQNEMRKYYRNKDREGFKKQLEIIKRRNRKPTYTPSTRYIPRARYIPRTRHLPYPLRYKYLGHRPNINRVESRRIKNMELKIQRLERQIQELKSK